ncbi:MAG: N,N'-diacetylchitobiose phosphorylase, partial [Clostridia bacterium]|nr:N,N'-diacetylchitobiose phosphorylase [Clostridia bacterium]
GESKEFLFALGQKNIEDAAKIMDSYSDVSVVDAELAELKEYWHGKLDNFRVETPDEKFNAMLNTWNAFQCFITFVWSRAASLIYCGQRNGYGYRDTVQDIQGIIHLDPEKARELLTFMLSAQVNNGAGLPLVKYTHNAGHEDTPDDDSYVRETGHPHYRADDAMWLFPTVYKYIAETGNAAYLDEVIPFANKEEGTVYEHLKRAIDFTLNHLAAHKMPAGLHADWNDCLRMGEKGESTFVAMQLYMAMNILKGFAEYKNDADYVDFLTEKADELYNIIQKNCWNEDRFIRGIREDGVPVGARTDIEASMWLNPQSWGVISGVSTNEQAEISLEKVHEILNTPYGVSLLYPPYEKHFFPGALMALFNPYTKENGGIFSQPQGWLILAESLMGHGNRAYEYFCESSPAYMNDKAEIRVLEPYVHGQFTESKGSPFAGRSHVHWLTGTASTVMVGCVEGICGMRPGIDYIDICPALPAEWKSIKIDKVFRGKKLHITVLNPDAKQGKVTNCVVNGEKLDGYRIPVSMLKDENEIVVNY